MTNAWWEKVCYHSLGHRTSQEMTYDICRMALERGVPGDFVECGVYAGASSAIMAKAIMEHVANRGEYALSDNRRVHLFDSFAGIPLAGPEDSELAHKPAGEAKCSLEDVKKNMRDWGIPDELLVYHPGWFQEVLPMEMPATLIGRLDPGWRIAVLRLDGDLYRSTKVCMDYLYPLVPPGGYVIVDDFDLSGCKKAILEATNPAPIYFRKPNEPPKIS
jgi:O-methyltransferase